MCDNQWLVLRVKFPPSRMEVADFVNKNKWPKKTKETIAKLLVYVEHIPFVRALFYNGLCLVTRLTEHMEY